MTRGVQLGLFGEPEETEAPAALDLAADRGLMAQVPEGIAFGTSSWSFPGWAGLVYRGRPSASELADQGLREYAAHPLFRTVGIDRSYYAPLDERTLAHYRELLPANFRCVMKAFSELTSAVHPRTRERNPHFLDADLCRSAVLDPILSSFGDNAGPVVFEFMPLRRSELPEPRAFADQLAAFLARLPTQLSYAVELRNRELLTHRYLAALSSAGAAHVLNYWERMPSIGAQLELPNVLTAPFVVARVMIPPGERYADRKRALAPFDTLQDPREDMRADVVRLALACEALGKALFVIVNNKAEGSSPLTIRALASSLVRALEEP